MDPNDRVILAKVTTALDAVRRLLDRRDYLVRELTAVEFELKSAWANVPHMPVRSQMQIELEQRRDAVINKAAHGDVDVARILKGMMQDG